MEALLQNPYAFDFYWAMRRLQAEHPDAPRIGESYRLHEDYLRLSQFPDFRFASSTLRAYEPSVDGKPPRLSVNFLGLLGPNGALPLHVTDYALDRVKQADKTMVGFLDVFHHRILSLFFRGWAVHQKAVDLDRPDRQRFPFYLGSFIGRSTHGLQQRDTVPDLAKLYFSGRLASQTRNSEGLAAILTEFFGVRAQIENFVGQWIKIPARDVCKVGASKETGLIGSTVIVGSKVWQCHTKFRIRFGPMRLQELTQLLPHQSSFRRLKDWVKNYLGEELAWDLQHILLASEVPSTTLGAGSLLGWTTWLTTKKPARDADDVIIDPELN